MLKRLLAFSLLLVTATWLGAQLPPPCPGNVPPADDCADACIYCNFNNLNSQTTGYTGGGVPGFCGTIENEQWLGFIANCNSATFIATPSSCTDGNGVQIALIEACGSVPIACYGGQSGGGGVPAQITAGMVIGQNYFLMIDGFAGDQCSFTISVNPPNCVAAPNVGATGPIQGPSTVCPGATVVYSIPQITGAASYVWDAPPGSTINGQTPPVSLSPDDNPTSVTITFGPTGGTICVQGFNSCKQGQKICKPVMVQPIPPITLAPVTICFEDAPYVTPWGDVVFSTQLAQTTIPSWLGCDSTIRQQVFIKPPIIKTNPPQTVCAGDGITVCNETIENPGPYSVVCQSFQGCDSTVLGQLLVFDPMADILNSGTITCSNTSVTLTSAPSQGIKQWFNGNGQLVGSGATLTVNQPGTYVLVVTATSGTLSCTKTDTVAVAANNLPPNASAVGGTLGCSNTNVQLNGGSTTGGVSFAWIGPNFSSQSEDPIVNSPGSYILTVTNPANGCTNTATATVDGNTTAPVASATGGTLTCATTSVVINASSNIPGSTYAWSNGQFIPNPSVSQSGNYIVTVTNPTNGCTSTASATVTLNNTVPGATAAGGTISCANPNITLNGNTPTSGSTFLWSGPGISNQNNQNANTNSTGTFTLVVTGPNGCTSSATTQVDGNTTPPGATAAGGTLSCAVASIVLQSATPTSGVTYSWTGPTGFTSSQPTPTVDVLGTYNLVITGPNSCTSTATAVVDGNFVTPNAAATGGTITCQAGSINITGTSSTPGASFTWNAPGNVVLNGATQNVSTVGTYTLVVTGPNGCTSTATADVNPDANLPNASASGGTIDCNTTSVTLNGGSTTPGTTFTWTGPSNFMSNLPSPTVTVPGNYTLVVSNPSNGCTANAVAGVQLDTDPPVATVAGGQISCGSPDLEIFTTATAPGLVFNWTGPSFTSTVKNPIVSTPGNYTLVVTGTNGCTASFTAVVTADQNIPIVSAAPSDILTCAVTSITINATSNNPNVTYDWAGPGFTSVQQNPTVSAPGSYVMTVTASNGCSATATAVVDQDIAAPNSVAVGATITCTNPTVSLSANSSTAGATYAWTGTGFSSALQNPTVNNPGDYVLVVTGTNGCTSSQTATIAEDRVPPSVAAISPDILTCAVTTVVIDGTITSTPSPLQTIAWSGQNLTSAVEDPQVDQPGLYTVVATAENGCTSQATVNVSQDIAEPNVSALGGTLTCVITSVALSGSSTTPGATYLWTSTKGFTSTDKDPIVTEDADYTLVVTGPNGCTNAQTVNVNLDGQFPNAAVSASILTLTCKEPQTTLTGTSTTTGVSYAWSGPGGVSSPTAVVPNVNASGTYTLAVTAPNGCVQTESIVIAEDFTTPDANATGGTIDCISGQVQICASSATAGVTYQWSGPQGFGSTAACPMVGADGPYIVILTGTNGCTSTASAEVLKNTDAPSVSFITDLKLTCADTLSVNVAELQTAGATGLWTGPQGFTSTNDTISVKVPGVYTYVATAANGCKTTVPITVVQDIKTPIIEVIGGDLNCYEPTFKLEPTTDAANPSYLWLFPDTTFNNQQSPIIAQGGAGVYLLTVNDFSNGCSAQKSVTITEDFDPGVITIQDYTLDCNNPTITIDVETTTFVDFEWSSDNGSFTFFDEDPIVDEEGVYTVITTALNGCTASASSEIGIDFQVPQAQAQGDTLTCTQPSKTITANSPTQGVTYEWSGPGNFTSNQQNPIVNQTGTYTVVVTGTNGCTSEAKAEVIPDANKPQIAATGGTVTCEILDIQINATSNKPDVTWAWTGPNGFTSNEQNPSATDPGIYTLVVTSTNGCTSIATAEVLANKKSPTVNTEQPEKLDCTTIEVTLNASVNTPGSYFFNWLTANGSIKSGANTTSPIVTQAGTYTVVVEDFSNGCTSTEEVFVEVDPATPSGVNDVTKDVSCFGYTDGSISVASVIGGTAPFLYSIDNQPFTSTTTFTFLPPGNHTLKIQDANGCEFETILPIGEPDQLVVNLGADTTIHLGESLSLSTDGIVNNPGSIQKLIVTPESIAKLVCDTCPDNIITPFYSVQYKVVAVDSNGCKASDDRLIIVDKERLIYIPNIFDPTSVDNSRFTVFGEPNRAQVVTFRVFDRWGELLYQADDFPVNDIDNNYWDGKAKGKLANPGVYVYYAEIRFIDGEVRVYKGDVALVRNN